MENNTLNHKEQKSVLLLIILFLISFFTLAQNNIVKIEPFTSSQTEIISSRNKLQLKSANSFLQISGAESILQNRPENLTLQLENILSVDNFSLPEMVSLDACNAITLDSKLVTGTKEGDKTINVQIATYKGIVGENGWISVSFTQNGMVGLLSFNGSTHVIQPIQSQTIDVVHNGNLIHEICDQKEAGECGVDSESLSPQIKQLMSTLDTSPLKSASIQLTAKVAVETDYETYVSFGNDSLLTAAYLLNQIAIVSQIYEREVNIKLEVAYCRVWTTPEDPYIEKGYNLWDELSNYWNANMQHIERDVAVLLIKDDTRLAGGEAALDALCNKQSAYVISGNSFVTLAHELGHIFGSPHTHNCSWPAGPNGTLAPIDQCASVEGDCGFSEIIPQKGTIMSYCPVRLEAFHPLVRNLIRARAESNPCIGNGTESFNTVSGKVIWNDIGLANVNIKASRGDGKDISTKTTADGLFSLSLPNKAYNITADRDSFLIDPFGLSSSRSVYVTVAGVNVTGVNYQAVELPPDKYEPDNNVVEAINISTNGDIQDRTIHKYFDDDFVCFNAVSGQTYSIVLQLKQSSFLASISLLDIDGVTVLAKGFLPPYIEWKAVRDGTYFIRIAGNKGNYGLSVSPIPFTKVEAGLTPLEFPAADWGDYDGDGDLDILVAGWNQNQIHTINMFKNDESGFIETEVGIKPFPTNNIVFPTLDWGDFDNDGDLDVLIAEYNQLYVCLNERESFSNRILIDDNVGYGSSASWGDFNNDGDLDILVQNSSQIQGEFPRLRLFQNNNGTFINIKIDIQGVDSGKAKWGDYNGDGFIDIIVAGASIKGGEQGGSNSNPFTRIYRNEKGDFINANLDIMHITGFPDFAFGDYDNDGDLDLAIAGMDSSMLIAKIYRNDDGNFTDINAQLTGVRNATVAWGDSDNDGDLDLLITGYERIDATISTSTKLYINRGGIFEEWSLNIALPKIIGVVNFCDFDKDNDLDILLIGEAKNRNGQANLLRNENILKNHPPAAPVGLKNIVATGAVTLIWNPAQDDKTPTKGLTYNVRIGTSPGGVDILAPMSDLKTGKRQIVEMGNAGHLTQKTIGKLTPRIYYWSVQAIDNSFVGSAWAPEQEFTIENIIPVANAGTNQYVEEGATVSLDGSLSTDPDGNPLTYKWTAPVGITLSSTTVVKPTFTAPEVSTNTDYIFSLVVNDGTVDSPADAVIVTVKQVNKTPIAKAGADQSVNEGTTVSLDGSQSSDPDSNPLTYKWTAPAGITLNSTSVAKPTFIAPEVTANTNYTFSLVVNDVTVDSPEDQVVITVKQVNKAPVANAGQDQSVNEGAIVTLDGSASSDPDGNLLTYKWTAPAGITLSSTTAQKPTFTAPEVSANTNYTFTLVVNDGIADSPADQVVIIVKQVNKAPVANAGSDQTVNEGAVVTLDGTNSSDPDRNPLTLKWIAPAGIKLSSTTVAKPTFKAPEVSADTIYTFLLVVNDRTIDSPADTVVIAVKQVNKAPVANAGTDQSVNEVATVSIDGSQSSDPDGNPLTYKWTAPAGIILSSTTDTKPTFIAPEVSTNTDYIFSLIVNDGTVDSPADQVVITVKQANKAPVANAGTDQSVNEGSIVTLNGSASSDPDGNPLSYKWTAPTGITLSSTTVVKPTFMAPEMKKDSIISFYLAVNDGFENSATDTVKITVFNVIKVGNSEISSSAIKIYPNPTTGMLTLEFTQNSGKKTEVSVSNLIGAEVFRKKFEVAEKFEIDLSNQVSGIYLLKVIVDNRQYISKIVIRKYEK